MPDVPPPPRLLVIDDAATDRRHLRQTLAPLALEMVEAADGVAGIERAVEGDFALALVDMNMAGLNGYGVVETLRQDARTRALPIVMLSAQSKASDRVGGYRAGANLYLAKPVDPDRFRRTVALLLGISAA